MLLKQLDESSQEILIFPAVSFQVSLDDIVAFSTDQFLASIVYH